MHRDIVHVQMLYKKSCMDIVINFEDPKMLVVMATYFVSFLCKMNSIKF